MASWFQNAKWFFQDMGNANREFSQGVKNDIKTFNKEIKDLAREHIPTPKTVVKTTSSFLQDIGEANRELVQGVRNDVKTLKNEVKELIHEHNPKMGEVVENVDRLIQTGKNAVRKSPVPRRSPKSYAPGDHIFIKRLGYEHHALYIGNGDIVHYSKGSVRKEGLDGMDDLLNTSEIRVKNSVCIYSVDEVLLRAQRRIGETDYNLALNNCEHFVTWCRSGGRYNHSI